ncbi:MAG: Wzz/FepE/Etk N-terminal domain-containing protein, partial [Ornithinimicrobium sp.]
MDTASSGSFGLPSLLTAMRHHLLPIVLVFLFVLSLGWAYTEIAKPTYTAEATTLVSPVPGNPLTAEAASASGAQLSVAMETEAGLVTTPAIAEIAST